MKVKFLTGLLAGVLLFMTSRTNAAIDLVTVPDRESVQLTIYNSADITMVRETRRLTFKKGLNRIQFSWAGTLIDPTSLRLSFKERKSALELLDTVYPPGARNALQWNIRSEFNGGALVELNYFTSGITWKADYAAYTNSRETHMNFKGYVRVVNNSGEDYPNARIRLVVGTVNLVENIANLARNFKYRQVDPAKRRYIRRNFRRKLRRAEEASKTAGDAPSGASTRPKAIVKEGLSEYFIFSIEGRETVRHRGQKRMRSIKARRVPLRVIYRLSDRKTRGQVRKFYEFKNSGPGGKRVKGGLGEAPLPNGIVHFFSVGANKNLSYRGRARMKYAARGDLVKLDAGNSADVVVRRRLKKYERRAITIDTSYRRYRYVRNYREVYSYETEIENTLSYPVKVEVERRFRGEFNFKNANFKRERVDKWTFRYYADLAADLRSRFIYKAEVFRGRP